MKKDTTLHTIAKRMMLLLLMMTLEVGIVWGQEKYVYVANGHYMAHCGSGVTLTDPQAVTAPTAFNPNTCLWETTSSGLLRAYGTENLSTPYYLNASAATAGAYYNAMVSTTSATIGDAGSAPYIQLSSLLDPPTDGTPSHYYCYHATNGWIAAENYGEATAPTVKTLTKKTSYEAGAKLYIDCPDVIGTDGAEPSVSASSSAKAFTHFVFDGTENHYWYDDADHTTPPVITPLECTSPTWSLATADLEYASIDPTTGVITVKKQTATGVTLTISCSATVSGSTVETSKTVALRGGYYVFINSEGKYVTKTATGHGTSDTFNADNAVWESESAVEASEYVTRYPITLIERKNITTVSAKINENYSDFTLTGKTYTFTASPTVGDNYYREYTINGTKHYWYNNADHNTLPDYSWGDITTSSLTYTWTVSDNTYGVTMSSAGVLTIGSTLPTTRTPLTVTCNISNGTKTVTVSKKVYLNAEEIEVTTLAGITNPEGRYRLASTFSTTGDRAKVDGKEIGSADKPFKGSINGGLESITGTWDKPLFDYVEDATIKNVIIKNKNTITGSGNVGAIAGTAKGTSRIYNCGILPYSTTKNAAGKVTGFTVTSINSSGSGDVGSIVGKIEIEGRARVINCFSYATITNGNNVAGIVGNLSTTSITQDNIATVGMVVNCMFYGEITGGTAISPVYGGNIIQTNATKGVNPYCYFRGDAAFNTSTTFDDIEKYKRSWPADEEYLTRFEYYRSILNSNRKLCTYWVTGKVYGAETNAPTEEDEALIAKWVLDPSMAPYPVLKVWGKYPSIINPDPDKTWNPKANGGVGGWQSRSSAEPYYGKKLGTLSVTVNPGDNAADGVTSKNISLPITDMDRANHDYGYYKVQLPYYNELFGDPTVVIDPNATPDEKTAQWNSRYGGNYKANVVTGWKVISVDKAGKNSFVANWENGYNFADRNCTDKDLCAVSGRVFAQGGFFYVPEGVTSISIEAYWGKAVYLHNKGHYIDRVNITAQSGDRIVGDPFTPAGTLSNSFPGGTIYDDWATAVANLNNATLSSGKLNKTVYDNAVVLLSNFQLKNGNGNMGKINSKYYPHTMMSIDQDFDNEPDYCFEFQFRKDFSRPTIQPIRFDFLPVPELGMAVRHSKAPNTIGIFIPLGHFEITETAFMHTTQFEYDANVSKVESPLILNGGHFEQIVVRYGSANNNGLSDRTSYILMGGHFRMLRFTPGAHTSTNSSPTIRLCAVNAIGGEYPEFYLSGIYRPDIVPATGQGNPHCYSNGGYFGMIAGAGYDKIAGDITFKIDHSIIDEFYGGGINGTNFVGGSIDVTIDHSLVGKYCGGPKVGPMTDGTTVTTHATGTTFTNFYGGGNGGTSYYRKQGIDGNDWKLEDANAVDWADGTVSNKAFKPKYQAFNPLNLLTSGTTTPAVYEDTGDKKGYHALYEFECFVESNGLGGNPTLRAYTHWAQFGTTSTGDIENILKECTFENDFYGGGNLGNVSGSVTSTLTDCTVKGNAFGGGFSGRIEPFRIHNKNSTVFPTTDESGVMHNGKLEYLKDGEEDRYYTWCYRKSATEFFPEGVMIPATATKNNPTFQDDDGNWHVLTTIPLENLGSISGDVELTLNGNTTVGTATDATSGNVYGGGNESAVEGSTTVTLSGKTRVLGNVFGGGNEAVVMGSATVNITQ